AEDGIRDFHVTGVQTCALPISTASAVVADLVDVARLQMADPEHRVPHLAFQPDAMSDIPVLPMAQVHTSFYLRLRVDDRPGVLRSEERRVGKGESVYVARDQRT